MEKIQLTKACHSQRIPANQGFTVLIKAVFYDFDYVNRKIYKTVLDLFIFPDFENHLLSLIQKILVWV